MMPFLSPDFAHHPPLSFSCLLSGRLPTCVDSLQAGAGVRGAGAGRATIAPGPRAVERRCSRPCLCVGIMPRGAFSSWPSSLLSVFEPFAVMKRVQKHACKPQCPG